MAANMTIIDSNFTDSNLRANFRILDLHPHPFYNDHYQKDEFIDKYTANVTMGVVTVASFFNFSIVYDDHVKTGKMKIRGFLDPSSFTKKLHLEAGALEWKLGDFSSLTFTQ